MIKKGLIELLNEQETELILENFFRECVAFWNRNLTDSRKAFTNAIRDIAEITTDPYSPRGEKINLTTRDKYVEYRKQDLGIFEI